MRRPGAVGGITVAVLALASCTGPAPRFVPAPPASTAPAESWTGRSDPVADPMYPGRGNPSVDVLRYRLDLGWAPAPRTLTGAATITLRVAHPVAAIALDFSAAYTLDAVTLDGRAAAATLRADRLTVRAPGLAAGRLVTLTVHYHGTPRTVPMPSNRGDVQQLGLTVEPDGSAWTMQEPFGAFTWYPVTDQPSDKALYDLTLTVPPGWTAVGGGTPGPTSAGAAGTVFRYDSAVPVASYLTTVAFGRYDRHTDTGPHGLPVTYWTRHGRDDALLPYLRAVPADIRWLEQRFGAYPFATVGVVTVDSSSAMETQQMVTLGADIAPGADRPTRDRLYEADVLHELAHQWFGDAVTPTTWRDVWLNEGWATYAQALFEIGRGRYTLSQWLTRARAADAASRVTAGPAGHARPDHFAEPNVYYGPALMLQAIHAAVGDKAFFALARDWVATHRGGNADRAEFTAFVNRHTGRDFTALIARWLDAPG